MVDKCCPNFDKNNDDCKSCNNQENNRSLYIKMIILECKSFFSTFKLIEPYIIEYEKKIKNSTFDKNAYENKLLYQFSYVVNGAFAAELAIKYLLTLADIDFCRGSKGHNLLDLYKKLLLNKKSIEQDRKNIISALCEQGKQKEDTILKNLESLQDCYNNFRYCFSNNIASYNNFFGVFINVICNYAIDKDKMISKDCGE